MNIFSILPQAALGVAEQLASIYGQAFSKPPYNESPQVISQFRLSLQRHVELSGFACVIAQHPTSHEIVGFSYGYTSLPGQWWYDAVTDGLSPILIDHWFRDCFELVDLAVRPDLQGQGIGGKILHALVTTLPHRTAALSTIRTETVALHLYQRQGWLILNPKLDFPGIERPYMLMGKELQFAT